MEATEGPPPTWPTGALSGIDILCGIPSFNNAKTISRVVRAVEAGLRRSFPDIPSAIVVSDGGSDDDTVDVAMAASTVPDEELLLLDHKAPIPPRRAIHYPGISGKGSALRAIFRLAAESGARACAIFDADLRSITPLWVEHLLSPVLFHGQDFVAPVYTRHKFDGTITNLLAFPMTAALYGRRIRQPIGGEFGFSTELASHWAEASVWSTDVARFGVDIWMTISALSGPFNVCQANLGAKMHDSKDPRLHLGPMFRQVAGSLFGVAGVEASLWLDADEILPVATYGFPAAAGTEDMELDVDLLRKGFAGNAVEYLDVWRAALSPDARAALVDATTARSSSEAPSLAEKLWVDIVLDYLVAYHEGLIERDLLLQSLTPLYLLRAATFVEEVAEEDQDAAEQRIDGYADLFLERKDRLRARWTALEETRS